MCGFLGEYLFDTGVALTQQDVFLKLLALSKHRGPDATETSKSDYYQLGFNRLAILDLSELGNQPKFSPSKRYLVVFNGEIYNYTSLKERYHLENLKSSSDTEVLVHLLDVIGVVNTIGELNGMFSIAIIDTYKQCLYLSRDFAGIKPMFYGVSDQGVVMASQFDQLFKHPWFKSQLQLRPELMKEYFAFGYMQAPNTIYNHIFQLKPGQLLKISSNATIEELELNELCSTKRLDLKEEDDIIIDIKNQIEHAVEQQMVSDVSLATFLSGGIDSPLITAIAKSKNTKIEAFTLAVSDKTLDESETASAYADHLNIQHHIEHVNTNELLNSVNEHFEYLSEPFGDYSSIPTYLLTKKTRQKHTVMLSGDGADELFFGYPRMLDVVNKQFWFKLPFNLRKPIIRLLNKLNIINTWAPYNYKTIDEWLLGKHSHILKPALDSFFPRIPFSDAILALYSIDIKTSKSLLQDLRRNEFYGHLQRVLVKVDRMSMANSLEVRVPFLDKQLINESMNFHPKQFNSKKDLKRLLKKLMTNYYPEPLIAHEKRGFTVPIHTWLRGALKKDVLHVIFNSPFYGESNIDVIEVRNYVSQYLDHKHDSAWGVWHIYAWQKWAIKQQLV
ncbi:asparagine synthase (glutamine-hydrolyzing) [Geojedonia litorea]|uniref:asparagine synthase (glutamine-hydrolyzing) n=1 Tax=Geojedonia litorea TaxID=1268269 RepID=A0ABV9N199_9FLAO